MSFPGLTQSDTTSNKAALAYEVKHFISRCLEIDPKQRREADMLKLHALFVSPASPDEIAKELTTIRQQK